MARKRLTEVLPFLLPLRIKQKEFMYYRKMVKSNEDYDLKKSNYLNHLITSSSTSTINRNTEFDIKYQYNKLDNLKMIAKTLDGVLIRPLETFSFNYLVHKDRENHQFKEGLVIVNGNMEAKKGGGICHMSNQLYHTFLYTPLTIIERHPHKIDYFPSLTPHHLMGLDATVSSGWLDLKVKNETNQCFQLKVRLVEENLFIDILSDTLSAFDYTLRNENIDYITSDNKTFKKYDLIKETYLKDSVTKIKEELIASDKIELAYEI